MFSSLLGRFRRPDVEKLKAQGDVQGLIEALSHQKDAQVRRSAAQALGDLGDARAMMPLVRTIQSGTPEERESAASALHRIIKSAVEQLVNVIQNADQDASKVATKALEQLNAVLTEQGNVLPAVLENARVGYQAAITLWTYQGSLNWNRFNVMLTANSIIMAVIGVAFTSQSPLPVFTFPSRSVLGVISLPVFTRLFPALGLFLCAVWFFLTVRGYAWHKYWAQSATELEEKYLANPIKTAARARLFGRGKEIPLERSGRSMRMGLWSRLARGQSWISYTVIAVFVIVYMTVLFQG